MPTANLDIRPISDLRKKFSEVADLVQGGKPVIFTMNGYGYMVSISYDAFRKMQDPVLRELNRVDEMLERDERHYTAEEARAILKERRHAGRRICA